MNDHRLHLSDADLLMFSDGELPKARATAIRQHLDSCWTCRARLQTLEQTITGFVRARNEALDSELPSAAGPRALLRARLAELSVGVPRNALNLRALASSLATAAPFLAAIGATLVIFELTVNAEGPRPNSRVTPGETRPIALAEVCSSQQAEVIVRHISDETQNSLACVPKWIRPQTAAFQLGELRRGPAR